MIFKSGKQHNPYVQLAQDLKIYALALVRNMDIAEDLVQDTLLKLYERGGQESRELNLKPYAFRILRNCYI